MKTQYTNCPYQQGCPEYYPSITCDTEKYIFCDHYQQVKSTIEFIEGRGINNHDVSEEVVEDE